MHASLVDGQECDFFACVLQSFCCMDKKGILSWPNPTIEKVFFLANKQDDSFKDSDSGDMEEDAEDLAEQMTDIRNKKFKDHSKWG